MTDERRAELKAFLRAMRARLEPGDAGLPPSRRRRRTPGLRIEEAAALAGVSLTWYSAFEGGKPIRVSGDVLERIARSLRLSPGERRFLHALVDGDSRELDASRTPHDFEQRTVDGFTYGPAFVCDAYWNIGAFNAAADAVYGLAGALEANLLLRMFADPALRRLHVEWERIARQMTEIFHDAYGQAVDDSAANALLARLREHAEFAKWWDRYGVSALASKIAALQHPELGPLTLAYAVYVESPVLPPPERRMLIVQTPVDDVTKQRLSAVARRD